MVHQGRSLTVVIAAEPTALVERVATAIVERGHDVTRPARLEAPRALLDQDHDARVVVFGPGARELIAGDDRPTLALVDAGSTAAEALRAGAAAVLHPDAPDVALDRALEALLAPLELEAAACECEASLTALLAAVPTGVALVQDGEVVSANRALGELLGSDPQACAGRRLGALVGADDADQVQRRAEAAAPWTGVARVVREGGDPVDARLSLLPTSLGGRPAVHVIVEALSPEARASRELTDLRSLVEERRDLVFLGALVQSVVHDLRNPLQAALFGISTLKSAERRAAAEGQADAGQPPRGVEPAGQGPRGVEPLAMIERKVREIDAILAELHDCAQPWRPARLPFPLDELLEGVRAGLAEAAAERQVRLELDAGGARFDVDVDPPRLKQALVNLARIAVEAAPPGTRVLLSAGGGEDRPVWIEVHDERQLPPAEGGPEAALAAGAARGSRRRLAISRRIIEAHEGTMTCSARAPRGAVVRVELPAAAKVT